MQDTSQLRHDEFFSFLVRRRSSSVVQILMMKINLRQQKKNFNVLLIIIHAKFFLDFQNILFINLKV